MHVDVTGFLKPLDVLGKNRIAHGRYFTQQREFSVGDRCQRGCDLQANRRVNDGIELRFWCAQRPRVAPSEPNSDRYAACQR